MTTAFQNRLRHDYDTLWQIIKVFHPDLDDSHFERFKSIPTQVKGGKWKDINKTVGLKYDWVTIDYRIKGYGTVSMRLDNCHQEGIGLIGNRATRKDMEDEIKAGRVDFYIGRFSQDARFKIEDDNTALEMSRKILRSKGYQIQSVDEWFKLYYED